MIDRTCQYCGFHYDASISYAGRHLPRPTFGRWRAWCCKPHRAKSYRLRRKRLQHQDLIRRKLKALEDQGQQRFFEDGAA